MNWFLEQLKKAWEWIKNKLDPKPPVTTTPAPTTPAPGTCHGDINRPLCEPILKADEAECPVPYGMDIRFWVWSPSRGDVIKCGTTAIDNKLFSVNGKQITGISKVINGQQWCYRGYKPTSSSNPLNTGCTGTYQNTSYRLIYETRNV